MADPGFSPGGAPTPKITIIFQIFAENRIKMKEFGPGGAASLAPPLRSANDYDSHQIRTGYAHVRIARVEHFVR